MDKNELKKALKPLIKECIKEVLLEQGVSSLVTEATRVGNPATTVDQAAQLERSKAMREKLDRQKKKMLDAIGNEAYNGVNLFEGTTPSQAPREPSNGPLANMDPGDPGVDISKMPNFNVWKKLAGN